jgi:phosphate starvation-inducible PhoH-like protein
MKCFYVFFLISSFVYSYKYLPLNNLQLKYQNYIKSEQINIIFVKGVAGTGKTLLACQQAIHDIEIKKKQKIIITRPLISVDNEELGFLPGTMNDKMSPWMNPIFDHLLDFISKENLDYYIQNGILEISPLGFMRGRTFKNSIIILDEAQNTTPKQMKMFLTRIGNNSKIIINGDLSQSDLEIPNGFQDVLSKLDHKYQHNYKQMIDDGFAIIDLGKNPIRHPIIKKILYLYD